MAALRAGGARAAKPAGDPCACGLPAITLITLFATEGTKGATQPSVTSGTLRFVVITAVRCDRCTDVTLGDGMYHSGLLEGDVEDNGSTRGGCLLPHPSLDS